MHHASKYEGKSKVGRIEVENMKAQQLIAFVCFKYNYVKNNIHG